MTHYLGLVMAQFTVFLEYAMTLRHGLNQKTPAVVISHAGIRDNASQFALGHLAWDEIEKMYPYEEKTHLVTNWWTKLPVIFRQRGVAILLKDSADLRHLLGSKAGWRPLSAEWYQSGKRRWLFIPEAVLPVTADALMEQINKFYVTEVRGC